MNLTCTWADEIQCYADRDQISFPFALQSMKLRLLTAFLAGVRPLYAGKNVTMNNLLPGKMDTKRLRGGISAGAKATGISEDEAAQRQIDEIPAKRFGTPEEFGNTCAFLCSAHAGYITGQNILMDGGLFPHAF